MSPFAVVAFIGMFDPCFANLKLKIQGDTYHSIVPGSYNCLISHIVNFATVIHKPGAVLNPPTGFLFGGVINDQGRGLAFWSGTELGEAQRNAVQKVSPVIEFIVQHAVERTL
jgi:hypothetical protein